MLKGRSMSVRGTMHFTLPRNVSSVQKYSDNTSWIVKLPFICLKWLKIYKMLAFKATRNCLTGIMWKKYHWRLKRERQEIPLFLNRVTWIFLQDELSWTHWKSSSFINEAFSSNHTQHYLDRKQQESQNYTMMRRWRRAWNLKRLMAEWRAGNIPHGWKGKVGA